jgi:hypothetical protein
VPRWHSSTLPPASIGVRTLNSRPCYGHSWGDDKRPLDGSRNERIAERWAIASTCLEPDEPSVRMSGSFRDLARRQADAHGPQTNCACPSSHAVTMPAKATTMVTRYDWKRPRALMGGNLSCSLIWRRTFALVRPGFLGLVPGLSHRVRDGDGTILKLQSAESARNH